MLNSQLRTSSVSDRENQKRRLKQHQMYVEMEKEALAKKQKLSNLDNSQ